MFGHKRTELNEMLTNWKKSPNLSRSGSLRSPSLQEQDSQEIEYPMNISPPLSNNQLFRSASTRSSRRLPFFRNNKHGIFNVNSNNNHTSPSSTSTTSNNQNSFVEDKPMKPVYINPNSDSVVLNSNLSPIQRERSPLFFSPRMGYRNEEYSEQEIQERKNRRRSKSFSGYTNVINRSINHAYYEPMPPVPPVPEVPPEPPKAPVTPKRSKSLTRGRTPTRDQHNNSTLYSARKAAQKVQQNQNNKLNSPVLTNDGNSHNIDPIPQQISSNQTTLKRTQSLKASLQRWGVEHKKSQSNLSNPPTPTTPTSMQNSIPPMPQIPTMTPLPGSGSGSMPGSPSMTNEEVKFNSLPRKLDHSMTNWSHASNESLLNLSRQNSLSQKSFTNKAGKKINGKLSNELLVSSLNDSTLALSESKESLKNGVTRSSSLKNSITENSTLLRKHSYRMSIYSDLDDRSSSDTSEASFIKEAIKEEDVENIIIEEDIKDPRIEEERPIRPSTPHITGSPRISNSPRLSNSSRVTGSPRIMGSPRINGTPRPSSAQPHEPYYADPVVEKEEPYYNDRDVDKEYYEEKSYRIIEEKPSNLYRDRRKTPIPPPLPPKNEKRKPISHLDERTYIEENIYANTSIYPTEAEDNSSSDYDDSRYPEEDSRYRDDSRYREEDSRYPEEDSRYPEDDSRYPEDDSRYPEEDSRYPEEDSRYPDDSRYISEDDRYRSEGRVEEDRYSRHDDKDDYHDNHKRDTISTYPEDDGVEEVVYGTIKTIRSTSSSVSQSADHSVSVVNSVSVSKEFPDITVLSNSDVGYDDISSVATPSLSTVNPSSIMTNPIGKSYAKPDLSTLEEVSYEDQQPIVPEIEGKGEDEKSAYTNEFGTDVSSPICNPNSILMGEKFDQDHYLPKIPPIQEDQGLKMKRSNSLTKIRKNILMRPRELFPRSASLKTLQRREDKEIKLEKPDINNSLSIEKEKKSVTESLDQLLVQLEKIKDDKPVPEEPVTGNVLTHSPELTEGNSITNPVDKERLIISNLERKTPEPVWGGSASTESKNKLSVEKNVADTNSIHIEAEEATMTEYTESRYTSEPEIVRKESPVKDIISKSSLEKLKRTDSEVRSFKSNISNGLQRSSSKNSTNKPVSVIQEREKKNSKGSLSPSLLSSSAWQYFNSNNKNEHRVIQPSQTPTSLGNNTSIYKSPKLVQRNRSLNGSRIIPPSMNTIPISEANKVGKSPNMANEPSSLRKVESIEGLIKPPSIATVTSRSNSIDSKNSVKESKIKKFGKLVRNASLSAKNNVTKPLYIISPSLPAAKPEPTSSPLIKEEINAPETVTRAGTIGRLRRRVPPEPQEDKKKALEVDTDVKNHVDDKVSVDETEVSGHSLLPSFSFNETPLSEEIRNALIPEDKDSTVELYNALNNKNSQIVSPGRKYRSHRRSMPRPRTAINGKKTTPFLGEDVQEESDDDTNEKQSIVLVSSDGLHKFNMVKQSRNGNRQVNEGDPEKENATENNLGMENGVKLEKGRLEFTVGGKDQEMSELAEKLLMEGGESKSYKGYFDQTSYIITPDKRKKKGEFLKNSLKIFKRKSSPKAPQISSPELISFSNNNGNMETYPLKPMKLGENTTNNEQSTLKSAASVHRNKSVHLTPILRKPSVSNNTFLNYSPTTSESSEGPYDTLKTKKKSHKIGKFWKNK